MSINYAILGALSQQSMTGYDLKKYIQNSEFMQWSGNNNQIYKSLSELLQEGKVSHIIKQNERTQVIKIYTITDFGINCLKEWVQSPSEAIEVKNSFLIKLACSKQLNQTELLGVIMDYENQVRIRYLMVVKKIELDMGELIDTPLEKITWHYVNENMKKVYEEELNWLKEYKDAVANMKIGSSSLRIKEESKNYLKQNEVHSSTDAEKITKEVNDTVKPKEKKEFQVYLL